ncbi:MAG: rhodanese-like domain-containing protein [Haloferacaceae archaeon]
MGTNTETRRRFLRASSLALAAGLAGCSTGTPDAASDGRSTTTAATRRTTATTTGTTTGTTAAVAGPKRGDDLPADPDPDDGYPPSFETTPEKRPVDTAAFERINIGNVDVPLVPVDVAYYWYARGEARFADARSETAYDAAHVFGAVSSPAPSGGGDDDPTSSWSESDRVVCYCACPHHLSSMRAAGFSNDGYREAYAIDEGFTAWRKRNYPVVGDDVTDVPTVRTIRGATVSAYAGETAWAIEPASKQMEATAIGSDGRYVLDLKFVDVDSTTAVRVKTPAYTVTSPLDVLTAGHITADGSVASPE